MEYLVKRFDDLERRMEQGVRDLRHEVRWMFGLILSLMLALHGATIALLLRAQHLL